MASPIETIQSIYQAFGQGDVPTLLAAMASDVRWEEWADNSAQRAGVPTMQARHGPDGVGSFFRAVAEMQIHEFKVLDMFGGDRQVAVEVLIDFTVPATGVRVRDEELHLWTIGADGKVIRMRHYVDQVRHIRAHGVSAA